MIEIHWFVAYALLGGFVGFFAGLLGIGGGAVMVPVLTSLFLLQGMGEGKVVHMALSTSMASIVFISLSSLSAHHKHKAILWPVVKIITPGIIAGALSATFIASKVSSEALTLFFVCFMSYVALQLLLNIKPRPQRELPGTAGTLTVGVAIGGVSALVAIGGGAMTVPFMTWCNVRVQKAIGTASAIGFPIALAGTAGYLISGLNVENLPPYTLGYIHLPAAIVISVVSYFTVPLGAKLTHTLPVPILKKVFAGLIILVCLKMLQVIFLP